MRLHPQSFCLVSGELLQAPRHGNANVFLQAQPASNQADIYPLHLRHRYDANSICHGGCQRHHHPGELAHVRTDMIIRYVMVCPADVNRSVSVAASCCRSDTPDCHRDDLVSERRTATDMHVATFPLAARPEPANEYATRWISHVLYIWRSPRCDIHDEPGAFVHCSLLRPFDLAGPFRGSNGHPPHLCVTNLSPHQPNVRDLRLASPSFVPPHIHIHGLCFIA